MLAHIKSALSICISVVPRVAPATVAGFAHFAAGIRELHGLVDQPIAEHENRSFRAIYHLCAR